MPLTPSQCRDDDEGNSDDPNLRHLAARLAHALSLPSPQPHRIAYLLRAGLLTRTTCTHPALASLIPSALSYLSTHLSLYDAYAFFTAARRQFGRTALLLSGGATMGLVHAGVIKCLWANKVLPRIISGSSGGSIIASIASTRTDVELPGLFRRGAVDLDFFGDDSPFSALFRMLFTGTVYDHDALSECLKKNLGDITFREAYNRTRRILCVTVSSSSGHDTARCLNFITAPHVLIRSAVACSCAVPIMYTSSMLLAKSPSTGRISPWSVESEAWIDGSVESDLPMDQLKSLFDVNHFIVCQVNPHVVPFLHMTERVEAVLPAWVTRVGKVMTDLAVEEVRHRVRQLAEMGVFPTVLHQVQSIAMQRYTGDVTVLPEVHLEDYRQLLRNPSWERLAEWTRRGEDAVKPLVEDIKKRLKIELIMDEILYTLRLRRLVQLEEGRKEQSTTEEDSVRWSDEDESASIKQELQGRSSSMTNVRTLFSHQNGTSQTGWNPKRRTVSMDRRRRQREWKTRVSAIEKEGATLGVHPSLESEDVGGHDAIWSEEGQGVVFDTSVDSDGDSDSVKVYRDVDRVNTFVHVEDDDHDPMENDNVIPTVRWSELSNGEM